MKSLRLSLATLWLVTQSQGFAPSWRLAFVSNHFRRQDRQDRIHSHNDHNYRQGQPQPHRHALTTSKRSTPSTTQLSMVFDFFRERSQEGMDQLNKFSNSATRGELGKGLSDLAAYTANTNQAFAVGLAKSRNRLLQNLQGLLTGAALSPDEMLQELTDLLLQADLGLTTAEDIVAEVQSLQQDSTKLLSQNDLKSILRGKIIEALESTGKSSAIGFAQDADHDDDAAAAAPDENHVPTVLFVMGANGMGKTTTIGKLAHRLRTEGNQTVLLAACDTFRAGAVEQLEMWAERAHVDIVGPIQGKATTPAAVLYNALDKAVVEKYDTVLVDTSGRLSNNEQLTAELVKMKRVIQKRLSTEKDANDKPILNQAVPHETLLVLDAAQGRMALDSAKVWNQEIGLTGLILTKLDGSARGGSVVAVSRDLQLPVKLIGVGEGMEDLRDFEAERFVDGLLGIGSAGGSKIKNEGKMLAQRLDVMRQERDARSKTRKKATSPNNVPAMAGAPPDLEMENGISLDNGDGVVELTGSGGRSSSRSGGEGRGNPRRPKNKKKKSRNKK